MFLQCNSSITRRIGLLQTRGGREPPPDTEDAGTHQAALDRADGGHIVGFHEAEWQDYASGGHVGPTDGLILKPTGKPGHPHTLGGVFDHPKRSEGRRIVCQA